MVDEHTFNDNLPILSDHYFKPTFENYCACEKRFARYTSCRDGLGGSGWDLSNGIGVYCLNTAVCSFGGLEDAQGKKISDEKRLLIDTRSLYRWLAENKCGTRILLMHHPTNWLVGWAQDELETIIATSFHLVVSGHVHKASAAYSSRGAGGSVHCVSPALFTRKSEALGYSFITMGDSNIAVAYRQWTPTHKFVPGTVFADSETGVKYLPLGNSNGVTVIVDPPAGSPDTVAILQEEFDEAVTSYSSKKRIWVERDVAATPETSIGSKRAVLTTSTALSANFRTCVISAPEHFGLTCLGRFLALERSKNDATGGAVAMMNIPDVPPNKDGVARRLKRRCNELRIDETNLKGVILDNWHNDKRCGIILRELQALLPKIPIVILQNTGSVAEIADEAEVDHLESFENLYLWSMTRTRMRELVSAYVRDLPTLEENAVTRKVIEEIDSLNLHRTPLNCLTILKLLEQNFDDSPVNRTEMIGRVLHLLFFEFQEIPRYNTRPDLKDCEYAIGYLC